MSKGEPKQESIAIVMKMCSRCNRNLPATLEYFHRDRSKENGLALWCKECRKKYDRDHYSLGYKTKVLRQAVFNYFLKKYCEYGNYIIRYNYFYKHFSRFAERFHISFSKASLTRYSLSQIDAIRVINSKKGKRKNSKKIKGIRFNTKGMKKFGISNLCNLEIDPHEVHSSQEACIKLSCEFGQAELKEIYTSCSPELQQKIDYNAILKCYKQIESYLHKLNKIRDTSVKIATALWLSNKDMTQRECALLSGCHDAALRNLFKLLKIEKDEYLVKEGIVEI